MINANITDEEIVKSDAMQYVIKMILSAAIIVVASEFSRKSGLIGGLIASLPLVSILALIWLYLETKDVEKVMSFSMGIFWMVLPSLSLFLILPLLLKREIPFYMALTVSCLFTGGMYYLFTLLYERFGIKL